MNKLPKMGRRAKRRLRRVSERRWRCTCGTIGPVRGECMACGAKDCPHGEPLHYHHDGCPACFQVPVIVGVVYE